LRSNKPKVLIDGGGIGGLTALLALRARGIDAELFEQTEAFRQVGAGIQLSSNATRILRMLGLGQALARVCVYPEGRDYRAWDDGDRLYYTPLGARVRRPNSARPIITRTAPICSTFCLAASPTKDFASMPASRDSRRARAA
jgi:2-polyprenyl-6-methoxyphenol hydroxylase-like FAD-dependent oxidoreductase